MSRQLSKLRNIGIIAHIDAGKTTVTERMLYYAGAKHKMGEVDKGTTETDFDAEEQDRGITIYSACVTFNWSDVLVNLIDTPGHVDFTAEVERSLRVLDGGVVIFSAREGVEAQSETVWRQADRYHVPRVAFINKMDREGADFFAVIKQMQDRLPDAVPIPIQIPVGAGPPHVAEAFSGIVDLIDLKLLTFDTSKQGAEVIASEIPENIATEAELWRGQMLESLYDYDDQLMELGLSEEHAPPDLVRSVLRKATVAGMIQPVLCGSALDYVGIQPLLDAVQHYLPSPDEKPPVEGIDPKGKDDETAISRAPNAEEPFCGLVFKIVADKHGDLCYVRVYSGELKAGSRVLNATQQKKENVPQLWHIQADSRTQVPSVTCGDIVGIIGLRQSVTGDTLCDTRSPIILEKISFPETVVSMAIEPANSGDRKKLADALEMMKRQDPTFRAVENEETGQTLISGMGELHLEVIQHRLQRDFNLNVKVHKPRVSYRETVATPAEAQGDCHRMLNGVQHTASVQVRLEPFEGLVSTTVSVRPGLDLPPEFLNAVLEELEAASQSGGNLGFPLMNIKTTLTGAQVHETESTELAFRAAAGVGFEHALQEAGCVLLEPIMRLSITTPEEYVGDFVSDLQQRRAIIQRTDTRGSTATLDAEAPLASMFGYSSAMRSLSKGRASCSMEPSHYGPAPEEEKKRFM